MKLQFKKSILLVVIIFTIPINYAQTIIYSQDFNNTSLPPLWASERLSGTTTNWSFGSGIMPGGNTDSVANFSTNAAIFNDNTAGDDNIQSVVLLTKHNTDISPYERVELTFDYALRIAGADNSQTLKVKLYDNDNSDRITIATFGANASPTTVTIDLTPYLIANPGIHKDLFQFSFEYDDHILWGYGAGIDNVVLKGYELPDNDTIFIHTTTASNQFFNYTIIDHPDLNNNPAAKIMVTQTSTSMLNNNFVGVWYNGTNWTIYNENFVTMPIGVKYTIYMAGKNSKSMRHIASFDNQGLFSNHSIIDNSIINNNPDANIIITHSYNPNNVYNNQPSGVWYDSTRNKWIIYDENNSSIPTDAAYNIIIEPSSNMATFRFQIDTPVANNVQLIDYPFLNNNPNAKFVITHNWGEVGDDTNVIVDKPQHVWYSQLSNGWFISNSDYSALVDHAMYNVVVDLGSVASIDNNKVIDFVMFPNPTNSVLKIESQDKIIIATVFNLLGKEVKTIVPNTPNFSINLTNINSGVYLLKLITKNTKITRKFIKK